MNRLGDVNSGTSLCISNVGLICVCACAWDYCGPLENKSDFVVWSIYISVQYRIHTSS